MTQTTAENQRKVKESLGEEYVAAAGLFAAGLAAEEAKLRELERAAKERLNRAIAERETAKEEYPGLVNKLEAQRKLRDRLETEISELTSRVELLEFHLRNDGPTSFDGQIKRFQAEYEARKRKADTLIDRTLEEMRGR